MSSSTIAQEDRSIGVIAAAPWRITNCRVLPGYCLAVTFRDGCMGILDCSTILTSSHPGIYAPLANQDYFSKVKIELGVLTWPNGADLDPSWMYKQLRDRKTWSVPF